MGGRVRGVMPQVWVRARNGRVFVGGRGVIRGRPGRGSLSTALVALAVLAAAVPAAKADEPALEAVRRGTGITNGIAVHVGVETGELTAGLGQDARFIVHGLARDDAALGKARTATAARAGLVTIVSWQVRTRLPYPDRFVNLLVADCDRLGADAPTDAEIKRVLVPGDRGAAWVKRRGTWAKVAVAMPATLDGWPQFNYDGQATNRNHDEEVGIPTGIQWTTGPHRATANNGYRFAHGLAVYERPDHTRGRDAGDHLVARDAFNGTLLWWQGTHGVHVIGSRKLKPFLIAGDSVVRLAQAGKPLIEYDARTGAINRSIEASLVGAPQGPQGRYAADMGEAVLHGDTLLQVVEDRVAAIDWPAGTLRWSKQVGQGGWLRYPLIDADNGMVYVAEHSSKERRDGRWPAAAIVGLHGLDAKTGDVKWSNDGGKWGKNAAGMGCAGGTIVIMGAQDNGGDGVFMGVDGKTGAIIHERGGKGGNSYRFVDGPQYGGMGQRKTLVLADGKAYLGGSGVSTFDVTTGSLLSVADWFNARCEGTRGTGRWILGGFSNLMELKNEGASFATYPISRGACSTGYWPAYGMLHYMPTGCSCLDPVNGFTSVGRDAVPDLIPEDQRLIKGPAFGREPIARPGAWPTYRADIGRSGWIDAGVDASPLKSGWSTPIAPPLAAQPAGPVEEEWRWAPHFTGVAESPVSDGVVVVSVDRERHTVVAVDAASGKPLWRFAASGRIVSPPVIADGRCIFGGRDGYLYCVDVASGQLAWRFLAARAERWMNANGQLESTWPLFGSVGVQDGVIVALAGYAPLANGGIHAWGIRIADGSVAWKRIIDRPVETQPLRAAVSVETNNDRNNNITHSTSDGTGVNRVINRVPYGDGRLMALSTRMVIEPSTGKLYFMESRSGDLKVAQQPDGEARKQKSKRAPAWPLPFTITQNHGHIQNRWGRGDSMGASHESYMAFFRLGADTPGFTKLPCFPAFRGNEVVMVTQAAVVRLDTSRVAKENDINAARWSFPLQRGTCPTSLIVAGDSVFAAWRTSEQNLNAAFQPASGTIVRISLASGEQQQQLDVDSAVIVNGLMVVAGRLYAVHEDGTLRCYAP